MCYNDVDPEYFIQSRVHEQLVAYTSFESDIIVGPALLALVHLSLLPVMRAIIIDTNILKCLLVILTRKV